MIRERSCEASSNKIAQEHIHHNHNDTRFIPDLEFKIVVVLIIRI